MLGRALSLLRRREQHEFVVPNRAMRRAALRGTGAHRLSHSRTARLRAPANFHADLAARRAEITAQTQKVLIARSRAA